MDAKMLTVAEYAELEQITKQAVYRRLKDESWKQAHSQIIDGKLFINADSFENPIVEPAEKLKKQVNELLSEVERKDSEIQELRERIQKLEKHVDDLTAGWRESQILHGQLLLKQSGDPEGDQEDDPEQEEQEQPEKQGFFTRIFGR